MKKFRFLFVLVVLITLVACAGVKGVVEETKAKLEVPLNPKPSTSQVSSESEAIDPTPTMVPEIVPLLANGKLLPPAEFEKYRQTDGTYKVPMDVLIKLSNDSPIVFEGEYYNTIGEHQVCLFNLKNFNTCSFGDYAHYNQGSFWKYTAGIEGDLPDDLIQTFGHDKWKNWNEQGMEGNSIMLHKSTGEEWYAAGLEPVLSSVQKEASSSHETVRCPRDQPREENSSADAEAKGDMLVVGAPGSYSCRTLFVGQVTLGGEKIARYWRGARDNFQFVLTDSHFYLIPESWGENEMLSWVKDQFKIDTIGQQDS